MFRGVAQLNLDAKGRMAIPAKYRDEILSFGYEKVVVTADPSKCLLIYPMPAWEPIEQKFNNLGLDERSRNLQRLIIGMASDVDMDGTGRILIPAPLREFAGLNKEVALVGQGAKFELWDAAQWKFRITNTTFDGGDIPPELKGFSL
ncbi:MAG: division/cell wall cluster transcriptional repressor MraZ [Nitrosomonas sp.]|jgi:MraZ protein